MEKSTEEKIRQRAHEIWERHHRPDGRDDEFWHQAETELREEHGNSESNPESIAAERPGVLPG
jgi:Protein of unknown function (DUF2934)